VKIQRGSEVLQDRICCRKKANVKSHISEGGAALLMYVIWQATRVVDHAANAGRLPKSCPRILPLSCTDQERCLNSRN